LTNLLGVSVHAAEYLKADAPRPVVLYEMVKGWLTGTEPELGTMHQVEQPRRRQGCREVARRWPLLTVPDSE
jgi:hypothetical protein